MNVVELGHCATLAGDVLTKRMMKTDQMPVTETKHE